MAEFVQSNLEQSLPELEEAKRIKLFSSQECRKIFKRREHFEYRLQKREKQARDFVEYIEYEKNVLDLVKQRRSRLGVAVKRQEIDIGIVKRIHKLYRLVCKRFQSDMSLWRSHIQFCQDRKEKKSISKIYDRMLQVFNKKPELWVEAAEFEITQKNVQGARTLLLRGLRFNPGSQLLLLRLFKMELAFANELWLDWEKRRGMLQEMDDKAPSVKHVAVIMRKAVEERPDDLELLAQFLTACAKYTFTDEMVDYIYQVLKERHLQKPQAWDLLAHRHLHHCQAGTAKESALHEGLAMSQYDEAVSHLNTEAMWELYVAACLETLAWEAPPALCQKRLERALTVLGRGAEQKKLSAQSCEHWVRLLSGTGQVTECGRVCALATTLHPRLPRLWLLRLQTAVQSLATPSSIHQIFSTAKDALPDKEAWPVWEAYVSYLALHDDTSTLEALFQEAASRGPAVSQPCRAVQLQWTFLQHGLKAARQLFQKLIRIKPSPPALYQRYLSMELSQVQVDMERVRAAYDAACHEHGHSHPELWASYEALELLQADGDAGRVAEIRFAAERTLKPELVDVFTQLRARLQAHSHARPSPRLGAWTDLQALTQGAV